MWTNENSRKTLEIARHWCLYDNLKALLLTLDAKWCAAKWTKQKLNIWRNEQISGR
jgi:hypothetical protein